MNKEKPEEGVGVILVVRDCERITRAKVSKSLDSSFKEKKIRPVLVLDCRGPCGVGAGRQSI